MDFNLRKTPLLVPLPAQQEPAVAADLLTVGAVHSVAAWGTVVAAWHASLLAAAHLAVEGTTTAVLALFFMALAGVAGRLKPQQLRVGLATWLVVALGLTLWVAWRLPTGMWAVAIWVVVLAVVGGTLLGAGWAAALGTASSASIMFLVFTKPAAPEVLPNAPWLRPALGVFDAVALPAALAFGAQWLRNAVTQARAAAQASVGVAARAERMAGLGAMVAGVAHEVNNPLTYVLVSLGSLRELLETPQGVTTAGERALGIELVSEAEEGAERVRTLVAQLKRFAKGDREAPHPAPLREALEMALRFARPEIGNRAAVRNAVTLDVAVPSGNAVAQVMMNLLVNAAHAVGQVPAPTGGHTIRVSASMQGPRDVVVDVEDTGPGVPPMLRQRIFEPFFTTRESGGGTGLGLAICQDTVRHVGGTLSVDESALGGARFRVTLPVTVMPSEPATPAPFPERTLTNPALPRVMLVDDDRRVVQALARLFVGCEVIKAGGGEEALALLKERSCALVLCDINMPGMSGPEMLQQLKDHNPKMAGRVVFMTGGTMSAYSPGLLGAPVLYKPISKAHITKLLARLGIVVPAHKEPPV